MSARLPVLGIAALLAAPNLFAQYTISTYSGSVQYSTGTVLIDDQPFQKTITNAPVVKKGERLTTGADGVAEVLLTPGVFVRMVANSSLRMDEVRLSDTRVAALQGSLMVECVELIKDNSVVFTLAGQTIEIRKPGLFRIDTEPPAVSVIHGAVFVSGALNATVTSGKELALNSAVPALQKQPVVKDDLYQFSEARSADSAYASNVASKSLFSSGSTCFGSTWMWLSPVGMNAFIPCGMAYSPFGYPFFGMNYGYLYDGYPYYFPPPVLVLGGGGYGLGPGGISRMFPQGLPPQNHSRTASETGPGSPVTPIGSLLASRAASSSTMKIPAFRDALSTSPSMVTVSKASYLASAGLSGSSTGNLSLIAPISQNRFQGATSLHRETSPLANLFSKGSTSSFSSSTRGSYSGGGSRAALSGGGSSNGSHGGGSSYVGSSGASSGFTASSSSASVGHASFSSGAGSSGGSSGGGHR